MGSRPPRHAERHTAYARQQQRNGRRIYPLRLFLLIAPEPFLAMHLRDKEKNPLDNPEPPETIPGASKNKTAAHSTRKNRSYACGSGRIST